MFTSFVQYCYCCYSFCNYHNLKKQTIDSSCFFMKFVKAFEIFHLSGNLDQVLTDQFNHVVLSFHDYFHEGFCFFIYYYLINTNLFLNGLYPIISVTKVPSSYYILQRRLHHLVSPRRNYHFFIMLLLHAL